MQVAWIVSNCNAANQRYEYAVELSKYISVDIYGSCGKLQCSHKGGNNCNELLNKQYRFYLAFENSNCKDYITEKLYYNALR
jgi:Glycosyltransferase family 10 (fucosyltransferase) C-term